MAAFAISVFGYRLCVLGGGVGCAACLVVFVHFYMDPGDQRANKD